MKNSNSLVLLALVGLVFVCSGCVFYDRDHSYHAARVGPQPVDQYGKAIPNPGAVTEDNLTWRVTDPVTGTLHTVGTVTKAIFGDVTVNVGCVATTAPQGVVVQTSYPDVNGKYYDYTYHRYCHYNWHIEQVGTELHERRDHPSGPYQNH